MQIEPRHVGDVNPGHPLPAVTERPARAELEGREHLGQCAAVAKHDAGAERHDPHAKLLGGECLLLPGDADVGEKVGGWSG